jgi:uncharacterized protein with PhoU and TrkA domain
MRIWPDFIAELIRAANTIHKLTIRQRRRMLERAYIEILDQHAKANDDVSQGALDPAAEVLRATGHVEDLTDDEVKELLLDAAEMIRSMRIAQDRGSTTSSAEPHAGAPDG